MPKGSLLSRLSAVGRGLSAAATRRLHVDERAFGLFRILLGLTLLFDLAQRSTDLRAFYTDSGVFPRELWYEQFPRIAAYSVYGLSGEAWFQAVLFCCTAIAAGGLLVGYRTKLSTLCSLLLLVSLQLRNPLVLNGADRLLSELLVVSLVLPLGGRWSVDALRSRRDEAAVVGRSIDSPPTTNHRLASLVAICYLLSLFVGNGLLKTEGELWFSGKALQYALRQDTLTILLGNYLVDYGLVLTAGSYLWAGFLLGSPLIFLLTGRLRTLVVSVFISMVVGMAVSMSVGLFPPLLVALLCLCLPPAVWERTDAATRLLGSRLADCWLSINPAESWLSLGRVGGWLDRLPVDGVGRQRAHRRHGSRLWSVVLVVAIGGILLWTASMAGVVGLFEDTGTISPEDHQWEMFAPDPSASYSWVTVAAARPDGTDIDVLRRTRLTADPPADAAATFPNFRWRQYALSIPDSDPRIQTVVDAVCETPESVVQSTVDEGIDPAELSVERVQITHTRQPISPTRELPTERTTLANQSC